MLRELTSDHGLGHCPKCGGAIDYGNGDHSGNSYMYDCWCVEENGCGWYGYECYTLTFNYYMENHNENEEAKNGRANDRTKGNSQWDGEKN